MKAAYIDTSLLIALRSREPGAAQWAAEALDGCQLFSSNLLEAEVRAFFSRKQVPFHASTLAGIRWILPKRTLAAEFAQTLSAGYLRGADLWHVATALYLRQDSRELLFATLDSKQGQVAAASGLDVIGML